MRILKFKRAYFFDEELKYFSHYSEWGAKIKGAEFTSPASNNYAPFFTDYQFTGIHDKNGKEIYEGDIVNHFDHSEIVREVIYMKGSFGYWTGEEFISYASNYHFGWQDLMKSDKIEIIGNIHKTPDLI